MILLTADIDEAAVIVAIRRRKTPCPAAALYGEEDASAGPTCLIETRTDRGYGIR